jgi:hypothetical protein
MQQAEKNILLQQILWDYNIPVNDINEVIKGNKKSAGHYNKEMIFLKVVESYSWFTVLQLFTPNEIKDLLTTKLISRLKSRSLRQKYEFVRKRLHQTLPTAG